jgi:hypothetical protein
MPLTNADATIAPPATDKPVSGGPAAPRPLIQLRGPSGRLEMCVLRSVSAELALVRLEGSSPVVLPVGTTVGVALMVGPRSQMFEGIVFGREEGVGFRDYGIRFKPDEKLMPLLEEAVSRVRNARKTLRATPGSKLCSLAVRAKPEDPWTHAELKDISCVGMGLAVAAPLELPQLAEATVLEVRLGLPPSIDPVVAKVIVLNRKLMKGAIRYGTRIEESLSPAYEKTKARIEEYVAARQQEKLAEATRRSLR